MHSAVGNLQATSMELEFKLLGQLGFRITMMGTITASILLELHVSR